MLIHLLQIGSINGTMIANRFAFIGGQLRNQTLMTFDNGATWNGIPAPEVGVPSNCRLVRL